MPRWSRAMLVVLSATGCSPRVLGEDPDASPMPSTGRVDPNSTTSAGSPATTAALETTDPEAPPGTSTSVHDTGSDDSSTGEPVPDPSWPAFEDASLAAGIEATHEVTLGHHAIGQAFADYDRDGWLDLYVTGGSAPSVLYRNEGDGTFSVSRHEEQVSLPGRATAGAAWGDYDNDGWPDLYVTAHGANALLHNEGGGGFTDVAPAAGVDDERHGVMATWGDYDRDGWLDLYVANHGGDHDMLYRNEGDGTFSNAGAWIGDGVQQHTRAAFAAAFLDYDHDGDLDLHVVNDHQQGNDLFRNDGPGCGGWCWPNVSTEAGTALSIFSMGQAIGDYDNDGDLDLVISDILHAHALQGLTAQGTPGFARVDVGVDFPALLWGTVFLDYDNDGWLDLYLASQDPEPHLANRLFRGRGDGTFEDVSDRGGADDNGHSYGVAYADYDHDGGMDLVVGNRGEGYTLYRNTGTTGPGHHWVTFVLEGGGPINRDAIGARVTVTDTAGVSRMAEVRSGSTMGGGNSMRLHFGLGSAAVEQVHVRWPDGTERDVPGVPTDEIVTLHYP